MVASLFLAATGGIAYWLANVYSGHPSNAALFIDPPHLDFGEVWENEAFPWTLPILNRTDADVAISDFGVSCNCLSIEPKSLVIPAGKTRSVKLTLTLTTRDSPSDESAVRNFLVTLSPQYKGMHTPVVWKLGGRVRSAITLVPRTIDFENRLVRGFPFESQLVVVKAHTPISRVVASADDSFLTGVVTKADPNVFHLTITPNRLLHEGPFQGRVFVKPTAADGTPLPALTVPVRGIVVECVQAVPCSLNLGVCALEQTIPQTVTLQSIDGKPFTVQSISPSSDDINVVLVNNDKGSYKTYQLRAKISRSGNHSEAVNFVVYREGHHPTTVTVPVNYLGVPRDGTED